MCRKINPYEVTSQCAQERITVAHKNMADATYLWAQMSLRKKVAQTVSQSIFVKSETQFVPWKK
jgi:hypothetical protein